ncbi:MAG TPA: CmcJ/NvfI family oxidoreductase [Stellaceae bacterium]|nr:CmcJ/NvfI family oxidoreductase [Stellaceae bacterium]
MSDSATTLERAPSAPRLAAVEAELNYLAPMAERARNYAYEPPAGIPRTNTTPDPHRMTIRDMRPILAGASLDTEGFAVARRKSEVRDFFDDAEVRARYYPEAEALLKDQTGADRIFVFDHISRRHIPGSDGRTPGEPRQPVRRVHIDHTAKSGPQRVRDLLPADAEQLLKGRVQIINLWRPIRGPLQDTPLGVCDAGSVMPADLVPTDLVYHDRVGETYSVSFNPAHRWYYVPEMTADEALFIKCFDSKMDGRARFTPHSAFTDPTTPANARPRESIELRAFVFHYA